LTVEPFSKKRCRTNIKNKQQNQEIRDREKTMRGLKTDATAILQGYQLFHNYIRPHEALDGKTPAQKAKAETDKAGWLSLIKKASQHQRFETFL
jgi:transposase InsO family protein